MKLAWAGALAAAAAVVSLAAGVQDRAIRITYPPADSIVSGATRIEATITPAALIPQVVSVVFY
ncbi:MAG TPA: hypothetical protein VFN38_11760, partial [Gemmatimonadaceae bacterium]|nr:hypothetical protein [Gemmatimonadaceae bacterium]